MALSISRKSLYWTAAGVIIAAVTLVYAVRGDAETEGHSQTQSGTGNVQGGDGSVNVGRDLIIQAEIVKGEVEGMTREEALQSVSKYADVSPSPGVANPYLIVDAPRHLWVRSSGNRDGYHVGAVFNAAVVWVDCVATTEFDPESRDDVGPVWLSIRWPNDQRSDEMRNSQPSDRYSGWIYSAYTIPAGHNGRIPAC